VTIKRITPLLFVPEVEPCVRFWTERLGFRSASEVPEGSKLAFAMLQKDGTEIMYQSYASLAKDLPALEAPARKGPSFLYVEVESLEAIKAAVHGADFYLSERTTFYGAREIGIKDPAGHYITFAEFAPQPSP
jgi:uncharacterized glyoxalase superfamily protein PhnB